MSKRYFILALFAALLILLFWVSEPDKLVQQPTKKTAPIESAAQSAEQLPSFVPNHHSDPSDANGVTFEQPDKSSHIKHCDLDGVTEKIAQQRENVDQQINTFLATLKHSTLPEKQLLYALLFDRKKATNRINLLAAFQNIYPNNKQVLRHLLGQCEQQPEHKACGPELIENVISLHGDNGAYWFQIADYYASLDRVEDVPAALQNAVNAPEYNEDYFGTVRLFIEASSGELDLPFTARAVIAFGYQAAEPVFSSQVTNYCLEQFKHKGQYADLCLSLAETLITRSKVLVNKSVGRSLLSRYRALNGESEASRKIEVQLENDYKTFPWEDFNKAANLAFFDAALFDEYLDLLAHFGEDQARKMLIKEAQILSKNEFYNPCP